MVVNNFTKDEIALLSKEHQVRFALFCCYQVKDVWKDYVEAVKAVETTERWLRGEASAEECETEGDNAITAAHAADKAKVIAEQWEYYYELLDFYEMFEKAVL